MLMFSNLQHYFFLGHLHKGKKKNLQKLNVVTKDGKKQHGIKTPPHEPATYLFTFLHVTVVLWLIDAAERWKEESWKELIRELKKG